ncbi:hypothetical protein FOH10_13115 [Nocardia otitidiscaviarum]|uniref:Uncharacterized protein n=1 Tax=Nocardia otitidiscaviarum TaxID=1823 RepID=A0A516NKS8_9NOCA|nr:hypothetical protein [Nocardia otitidiscaviarum]MCP9618824.1 hypothetical protein [Nocardia otitidiscaviarum]QDP79510.1 hypothetical protein FOH10_13115 [Nocardia otitidiscaviarum]
MSDLVTRAQTILLARTLHVPAERLTHLEKLGAQGLHELQERMARVIFERHNATFSRLSMLVPVVPLSISLPLVQRLVPPVMAGRAAGAIGVDHPRKAVEALDILDPAYAADGAPYMDPHTVGRLADVAPPQPVVRIVNEILRRRDYVTAGPFLAYATPQLIEAVEHGVHDDEGLIRSAAYSYSGESISVIVRHLLDGPTQRIPRLIRTIVSGPDELRLAALSVFARTDPDVIAAIGDVLFDLGTPEEIADLVTTFLEAEAVPETLRFIAQLSPTALAVLAANPIMRDTATVATVVDVLDGCAEHDQWRGLLVLSEHVEPDTARRIGTRFGDFDTATLARLPAVTAATELWPPLLRVLAAAEASAQSRIGETWSTLPESERRGLEQRIREHGLDEALAALTATLHLVH